MEATERIDEAELMRTVEDTAQDAATYAVITTDEELGLAVEFLRLVKDRSKAVREWFADPIKKANEAHKALTKKRTDTLAPLENAERKVKGRIGEYQAERERKAREAQEAAEREARRIEEDARLRQAEKLEAEGDSTGAEAVLDAPMPKTGALSAAPAPKIGGGVHTVETWHAEVTDFAALPDEYKLPDTKALGAVARALKSKASVPGVRFYSTKDVRARA